MSYAVVWREDEGPVHAGRLELDAQELWLVGAGAPHRLAYRALAHVDVERRPHARLASRPTLVLEGRRGRVLHVACVQGLGSLLEVVETIEEARREPE